MLVCCARERKREREKAKSARSIESFVVSESERSPRLNRTINLVYLNLSCSLFENLNSIRFVFLSFEVLIRVSIANIYAFDSICSVNWDVVAWNRVFGNETRVWGFENLIKVLEFWKWWNWFGYPDRNQNYRLIELPNLYRPNYYLIWLN